MIATLLFAAAGVATNQASKYNQNYNRAAGSWCDSLAIVARATAEARAHGVPYIRTQLAAQQLPTPQARTAARAIAELVYTRNADGGLSPTKFADLVRQACMHAESP